MTEPPNKGVFDRLVEFDILKFITEDSYNFSNRFAEYSDSAKWKDRKILDSMDDPNMSEWNKMEMIYSLVRKYIEHYYPEKIFTISGEEMSFFVSAVAGVVEFTNEQRRRKKKDST
jgi:hypothetical protein